MRRRRVTDLNKPKQPYIWKKNQPPITEMSLRISLDTIRHFSLDKDGKLSFIDEVTRE
jgi:hypothetical protein